MKESSGIGSGTIPQWSKRPLSMAMCVIVHSLAIHRTNLDDFFLCFFFLSFSFTLPLKLSIARLPLLLLLPFHLFYFYCTALDCVSSIRFLDFSSGVQKKYVHRFIKKNMFLKRRHGAINTHTHWNDFYAFFVQALKPLKQLK